MNTIPLKEIKTSLPAFHNSLKNLTDQGYGLFSVVAGFWDKPTLMQMALSDKMEDRDKFINVVQRFDNSIVQLAMSIWNHGMLYPILVRKEELICGRRRVLAAAWLAAKNEKSVRDCLVPVKLYNDVTNKQATELNITDTINTQQLLVMDKARLLDSLKLSGSSLVEISDSTGFTPKHIEMYIRLLDLPGELQARVNIGNLTITEALKFLDKDKEQ
jgi:ParB/RepB/Spo0J family partition protein